MSSKTLDGKVVSENLAKETQIYVDSQHSETMSVYELSRWHCLLESIEYIDQKVKQLDFKGDWVKPIAIQKYIDERTPSMLHEISTSRNIHEVFVEA